MVLKESKVFGDDLLGWCALETEMSNLQPQAFLQITRCDANGIERLHVLQRAFDIGNRPLSHRRDLFYRGDQISVVVEVADNRGPDLFEPFVVCLEGELPEEMVGE